MSDLELAPEYVLQPHAVSRAIYRLSATARKIIAMGMALLPADLSSRKAKFSYNDFCQSLGLNRGGNSYAIFEQSVDECMGCIITLDTGKGWKKFTWIQMAEFNTEKGILTVEFSEGLADYLIELKKMYARIQLQDLGKLQSLYALRIYEMAKSYESLAGKQGNHDDCWYFDRGIDDLRLIMGIKDDQYKRTGDLKVNVIEKPVKEINEAHIGLVLSPEYIRKGKFLVGVRFNCQRDVKQAKASRRSAKAAADKSATGTAAPSAAEGKKALEEKENEHLKLLYPDDYEKLYAEEYAKPRKGFETE